MRVARVLLPFSLLPLPLLPLHDFDGRIKGQDFPEDGAGRGSIVRLLEAPNERCMAAIAAAVVVLETILSAASRSCTYAMLQKRTFRKY